MKNRRNQYSFVHLYVGRMKPLSEGSYSRNATQRNHKPTEKVFVEFGQYYFHKRF